ncbi:MAG: hypothetical protein U0599_27665 [Vicinamibacteria bacterium]
MERPLTLALCGLAVLALSGCGKQEAPAAAPPEVVVAGVVRRDVPVYMELVGQTKGSQDVEIRARVEGYLDRVAFTEGSFVHRGGSSTRSTRSRSRRPWPGRRPSSPPRRRGSTRR